jgi:hypothetical protein
MQDDWKAGMTEFDQQQVEPHMLSLTSTLLVARQEASTVRMHSCVTLRPHCTQPGTAKRSANSSYQQEQLTCTAVLYAAMQDLARQQAQ